MNDTIAALASGRPPAALAVIRLSGSQAFPTVQALVGRLPPPRRMSLCRLVDPASGVLLDTALVVIFPGPNSASGEDLAELHLHGGTAVIAGVLSAVTARPCVRLAEAGEYTRRAFHNGRMDLAQVEGLSDLIAAETASQRNQALALAGGALGRLADAWRERCMNVLADAEAGLDFGDDEDDVAERLTQATGHQLIAMARELEALLADATRAARIRDGLTIVITGAPNVGKSSLINALSMRDAAIVTAQAGTTRDVIEVPIILGGAAAVLIDTAGLRDTDDQVEAIGISRARARAVTADLVLIVASAEDPRWPEMPANGPPHLRLLNKQDLAETLCPAEVLAISTKTGLGLPVLRDWLENWAQTVTRPGEPALLAHARHQAAFSEACAALQEAAAAAEPVLRAEALRVATHAFGRIAGRVAVDDVLDRIFSQFCIGK